MILFPTRNLKVIKNKWSPSRQWRPPEFFLCWVKQYLGFRRGSQKPWLAPKTMTILKQTAVVRLVLTAIVTWRLFTCANENGLESTERYRGRKRYLGASERREKCCKQKWTQSIGPQQISAKRGPASWFVVEANTEALESKSNSRLSESVMVRGRSICHRSEYQIAFKTNIE